ncbi:hypothetical protein MBM_05790 [Drepanopeziza brunnea f. sp. 'multigermtubi' MB_m1]|uniref:Uncharacterized protein n=2 Tax=Drepanopeziza brunnea f. sp. 'multigermtubi' TaxID=698441 RepID=K1XTD1_MARBU|nr:uncharacterized protein MBM_05790 [Drepanopeziza brunnea f. sp. 'multigermtubi' MB_m1]EKD15779.1 hypothetical protein MBM_05790 [Drepanopeziza brunnea f. sp. 'multigermtubi' MB_m1]
MEKAWIPKYDPVPRGTTWPIPLWDQDESIIAEYMRTLGVRDPDRALRFSNIAGAPGKKQVLIPSEVVNDDELNIYGACSDNEMYTRALPGPRWQYYGIAGDPGPEDGNPPSLTLEQLMSGADAFFDQFPTHWSQQRPWIGWSSLWGQRIQRVGRGRYQVGQDQQGQQGQSDQQGQSNHQELSVSDYTV